jgi:hypothetical protein
MNGEMVDYRREIGTADSSFNSIFFIRLRLYLR